MQPPSWRSFGFATDTRKSKRRFDVSFLLLLMLTFATSVTPLKEKLKPILDLTFQLFLRDPSLVPKFAGMVTFYQSFIPGFFAKEAKPSPTYQLPKMVAIR